MKPFRERDTFFDEDEFEIDVRDLVSFQRYPGDRSEYAPRDQGVIIACLDSGLLRVRTHAGLVDLEPKRTRKLQQG